jgi:hypothetical protein
VKCKSGALTPDGGKFSNMRTTNSSTGKPAKSSMLEEAKMKKDKQFNYLVTTEAKTKNGLLFILTRQRAHKLRDSTRNSDSMSIDLSTLFPSSHSTE